MLDQTYYSFLRLMKFLNSLDGLNNITFLLVIILGSFVLGFRPIREFFCLIVKVPNSSNHTHLEVGEETIVSWSSDDCRALDIGTF